MPGIALPATAQRYNFPVVADHTKPAPGLLRCLRLCRYLLADDVMYHRRKQVGICFALAIAEIVEIQPIHLLQP